MRLQHSRKRSRGPPLREAHDLDRSSRAERRASAGLRAIRAGASAALRGSPCAASRTGTTKVATAGNTVVDKKKRPEGTPAAFRSPPATFGKREPLRAEMKSKKKERGVQQKTVQTLRKWREQVG